MRSFFSLLLVSLSAFAQPANIVIDAALHHLGEKEVKTFPPALKKPENPRLDATFLSLQGNATEWTLRLDQRQVTDDWAVELNGQAIARLNIVGPQTTAHFAVPPQTVKEGENKLSIVPRGKGDEIIVGKIELLHESLRDVRKLGHVKVKVVVTGSTNISPVRITIANSEKIFADLYNVQPASAAWRNGIVYSAGTPVEFDLPQGEWMVSATRGMEWSQPRVTITTMLGGNADITLPIAREVDTTGYISVDTHLHTYTFSRHGDASYDERVVSLAGEGVEMAISTDHNHATDYRPKQAQLGLTPFFTPVIGNEVTTGNGHFNSFPFPKDAKNPNTKETNWVRLVEDIRSKGVQYIVLNHPRWPAITNSPFSIWGLNRASGAYTNSEVKLTMDAIEILNSTFTLKDPDFILRDWFALWSRGERVWGVGASDTHTVRDIAGQGRTYVVSATDDPAAINVDAVIKQMQAGNMSISYGIFGRAKVNDKFVMGQLAKPEKKEINVDFHVASASWAHPKRAVVYLNGVKVAEENLNQRPRAPFAETVHFKIPAPKHDGFLICVAYGDGLKDPAWPTYANYTMAITNPVFIDADQDGKYQSPRETAVAMVAKISPLNIGALEKTIGEVDAAIGVQMLSEAKLKLPADQLADWQKLVEKLAPKNVLYDLYRTSGN